MKYRPTYAGISRREWVFTANDVRAALLYYLRSTALGRSQTPPHLDGRRYEVILIEDDFEHAATLRWSAEVPAEPPASP